MGPSNFEVLPPMSGLLKACRDLFDSGVRITSHADFLAPLALRLYLAPIFWMAGWSKAMSFSDTVDWFGAGGLGLPLPTLMATLATGAELVGAVCLLSGLAVRAMAVPLMFTMIVAMATVHWENGWLAVAEGQGFFATERTMGAIERLSQAKDILREHGDYDEVTANGSLVILNNGIEFSVTYLIMLLSLFFTGAGRWLSLDYWIGRGLRGEPVASMPAQPAYTNRLTS